MKKRLLSIDGGGIRGIIAGEVLKKIESIVIKKNPGVSCLGDYFDFIGGTSTGSIIAAGLSKGMKVDEILNIYTAYGKEIFQSYFILDPRRLKAKYNPKNLQNKLKDVFGDLTLGSSELKSLLLVTTKNIGSGSTWFFTSNKDSKFYPTNKDLYIRDLLRSSSAAPTYFPPHSFEIAGKQNYFIDGGVSSYNNPSLQLFLEATQEEYGLGWETGAENLQVISIGTGFSVPRIYPPSKVNNFTFTQISWIGYVIGALMEDANLQQNILMKTLGSKGLQLDDQLQFLKMAPSHYANLIDTIPEDELARLFDYRRYTVSLTKSQLNKLLNIDLDEQTVDKLNQLDCVDCISLLSKIGAAVANEQVKASEFD